MGVFRRTKGNTTMQSLNHTYDLIFLMEHHLSEMRDEAVQELETKKGRESARRIIDEMDTALESIAEGLNKIDELD